MNFVKESCVRRPRGGSGWFLVLQWSHQSLNGRSRIFQMAPGYETGLRLECGGNWKEPDGVREDVVAKREDDLRDSCGDPRPPIERERGSTHHHPTTVSHTVCCSTT
jgi:hypothetical protein